MRTSITALLLLAIGSPLCAQSLVIVGPGEVPVYTHFFGPAPFEKGRPQVVSNGEVLFAAWDDARARIMRVIGTPLTPGGIVANPAGVLLAADTHLLALVADRTNFAAFVQKGGQEFERVVIAPSGTVLETQRLDAVRNCHFVSAAWRDSDARIGFNCGWGLTLLNAGGAVANQIAFSNSLAFLGATETEWVMVRTDPPQGGMPSLSWVDRRDRNGNLIATFGWPGSSPFPWWAVGSVAESGGVLDFVGQDSGGLVRHRVSPGAYQVEALPVDPGATSVEYSIQNGRYLGSWVTRGTSDGLRYLTLVRLGDDGKTIVTRQTSVWPRDIVSVTVYSGRNARVVLVGTRETLSDQALWVQPFSNDLVAGQRQLMTMSGATQSLPRIAATGAGYLITWQERAPSGEMQILARRFSRNGAPLDGVPVLIASASSDPWDVSEGHVVALEDTYILVWQDGMQRKEPTKARRLSAAAQWLDSEPILLPPGIVAIDSNGSQAVAAGSTSCGTPAGSCIATLSMAGGGTLTASALNVIARPDSMFWDLTVASNGSEFLVAWTEGIRPTGFPTPNGPHKVRALRVRADGTAIDREPLLLDSSTSVSEAVTATAEGGGWVVAWRSQENDVRGARVTREGAVRDVVDGRGSVVRAGAPHLMLVPRLAAGANGTILTTKVVPSAKSTDIVLTATTIPPGLPLAQVAARPSSTIVPSVGIYSAWFDLTRSGDRIAIVYARVSGETEGHVPRVYLKLLSEGIPRRRVVAH